ncbi:Nn.00g065870.m01.CDS01, partial [Neocucurbitaria sp. VM-36]
MHFLLKFLVDDPLFEDEQPYELFGAVLKPGVIQPPKLTNCSYHVQNGVTVKDVRDRKSGTSLDKEGFTFVKHRTSCLFSAENFEATGRGTYSQVVLSYLHEIIALVKQHCLPEKVIVLTGGSDVA